MSIKLSDSIRVGQQKPLEDKYFNELVPYTSTFQVNTLLPKAVRHIGLTVNINGEEYWYKDGIEDDDLIFKSNQKTIEITIEELYNDLIPNEKLEPNRLYKIRGVESWCFSQHLIKAIYLKAITNNTLESEGVGEFYTPKYNTSDSNLGIWKGELLANGMISSASYNIGDKVIWGNLFWENISGNIGTNFTSFDDRRTYLPNYLSETDWQLITPNDDESLYNIQFDSIKYDLENDYINYRADNLGNVYEISYSTLLNRFPNSYVIGTAPEFMYNINSIALFQWGRGNTSNNIINESIVLNCNYNVYLFQKNIITENSKIFDNNFFNVNIVSNNVKNSSIVSNYLKHFGGIIENNLEDSIISSNRYYFEISYNNLKYNSSISNNNDNNIIVNTKYSRIKGNILNNSCSISNNIFVEEGKSVTSEVKGIYDNNIQNLSTISGNTIKNGSRIFGHRLEYYSTINGNTLDTDANIYNNQLIQNGKIDNNILTGHGRIYGNQLDRQSEITLCKLRISPATSYASGIHTNKLFTGKIQNVDFGDIVNPVGSDPNDPAFGGNALSECIIENISIIKDLTFTDVRMKDLKLIKMNGYSEFKNITINDSIKNVDFINTIFNETSDYSKLIQGSGLQTDGFTKTYIDGVLLKDRFDEKQDVLTEDNLGAFMDSELSTKSAPTSGDTVLGRDSLTGKAVEIPTNQLGGNVDTSNLVPYTGATQDVNIGANYFEATGYKTPNGTPTQFLMANGSTSTLPTDLIRGTGTLNYIPKFSATGTLINSIIREEGGRIVVSGGTTFQTNSDIVMRSISGDNPGDFVFQNTSGQEQGRIYSTNDALIFSAGINPSPKMVVRSNGIGINIPTLNPTEWLEVNGYAKATGFKTPTGTATQALIANGGVFDLNTKADLVGGKVPKTQSQPSTMVMNNSTYVITFTDATGAVQTIDLPLESLFQNANYDETTKSLIVTLQDGTTRTIPLTDLVDLPEIVLATSIPAVNPTTGQKVYFNTSLGKVWFNVSGAWVFGGNLISDTEKANITTAYNHSQETGNPHDTELEELTDVSGDVTSIIDTDVILKKEAGGFWRKITFANFKSWFTTELAKKINIGLDTVFNFKNISAMTLTQFKALTPNIETIYFTEEQNATGWQQIRYSPLLYKGFPALIETAIILNDENHLELDSDSTFNLIDVANTKINGIFEKDFVIITFSGRVRTPTTANQWFKIILRINGVQTAVSPVFYLLESAGTDEEIAHSFALTVPAEMVTYGATLHIKASVALTFECPAITVVRVHKSTNANL